MFTKGATLQNCGLIQRGVVYRGCSLLFLGSLLACSGDSAAPALPVCTSLVTDLPLPALTPRGAGPGWGNGPHVYSLVAPTGDGWTLALVSGTTPAADGVTDTGNFLDGLVAGDRISVDGVTSCQSFSGCKRYEV